MSISNNQYDFKTISDLIALDHIKEALTKMKDYTKLKAYTKLNNETVQCISRFSKNENDKNMGVICDLTYSKEHTQIQKSAISLNDNILQYDTLKKEETKRNCQIQVIINGELENFKPEDKFKFKNILAATLDIDSDLVSILEVKEGSIKLTIELPLESAKKLISLVHKKDVALDQLRSEFEVKEIRRIEKYPEIQVEKTTSEKENITYIKKEPNSNSRESILNEQKLVAAYIRKDPLAQKEIYQLHKVYLFGICMRYAKNRIEAEDMLQNAFKRIFKDIHEWSGSDALRAWMRRVTINAALMHIRKYRKFEFNNSETPTIKQTKINFDFSKIDLPTGIINIIQQLPEPYQTVFNLRAIDNYSFKEIATKLGIDEAILRSYYLRARKKLEILTEKQLKS